MVQKTRYNAFGRFSVIFFLWNRKNYLFKFKSLLKLWVSIYINIFFQGFSLGLIGIKWHIFTNFCEFYVLLRETIMYKFSNPLFHIHLLSNYADPNKFVHFNYPSAADILSTFCVADTLRLFFLHNYEK